MSAQVGGVAAGDLLCVGERAGRRASVVQVAAAPATPTTAAHRALASSIRARVRLPGTIQPARTQQLSCTHPAGPYAEPGGAARTCARPSTSHRTRPRVGAHLAGLDVELGEAALGRVALRAAVVAGQLLKRRLVAVDLAGVAGGGAMRVGGCEDGGMPGG